MAEPLKTHFPSANSTVSFGNPFFVILLFGILSFVFLMSGCSSEPAGSDQDASRDNPKGIESSSSNSENAEQKKEQLEAEKELEKVKAAEKKAEELRKKAAEKFEKLFTERINGTDPEVYNRISEEFLNLGPKTIVPQLVKEMKSELLIRREIASTFLSSLALEAKDAEEVLVKALEDESLFVRINAASTLSVLNSHVDQTVETLTSLLSEEDSQIRHIATVSLRNVSGKAAKAVPKLVELLQSSDTEIKKEILKTLQAINQLTEEQLAEIQKLADNESEEEEVRESAKKLIEGTNSPEEKETDS